MKPLHLLTLAVAVLAGPARSQSNDAIAVASQREAMNTLSWMDGRWRGTAVTQTATGEHRVTQTGGFLAGTIKVIEGRGFNADGSVGFNAFGVVSYDVATKTYAFRSYAQGRAGTFGIAPIAGKQGYVWEIPAGPTTIRYTATIEADKWHEVGDQITPGRAPVRFFDMLLTRFGDTDWPATGAMTPR